MKARKFPTFGQIRHYLEGLGFTQHLWDDDGYPQHVFDHAESGCRIILRDRPDREMIRAHEALSVHHHLWWRGLIDDDVDIYQFLADFVAAKTV